MVIYSKTVTVCEWEEFTWSSEVTESRGKEDEVLFRMERVRNESIRGTPHVRCLVIKAGKQSKRVYVIFITDSMSILLQETQKN